MNLARAARARGGSTPLESRSPTLSFLRRRPPPFRPAPAGRPLERIAAAAPARVRACARGTATLAVSRLSTLESAARAPPGGGKEGAHVSKARALLSFIDSGARRARPSSSPRRPRTTKRKKPTIRPRSEKTTIGFSASPSRSKSGTMRMGMVVHLGRETKNRRPRRVTR